MRGSGAERAICAVGAGMCVNSKKKKKNGDGKERGVRFSLPRLVMHSSLFFHRGVSCAGGNERCSHLLLAREDRPLILPPTESRSLVFPRAHTAGSCAGIKTPTPSPTPGGDPWPLLSFPSPFPSTATCTQCPARPVHSPEQWPGRGMWSRPAPSPTCRARCRLAPAGPPSTACAWSSPARAIIWTAGGPRRRTSRRLGVGAMTLAPAWRCRWTNCPRLPPPLHHPQQLMPPPLPPALPSGAWKPCAQACNTYFGLGPPRTGTPCSHLQRVTGRAWRVVVAVEEVVGGVESPPSGRHSRQRARPVRLSPPTPSQDRPKRLVAEKDARALASVCRLFFVCRKPLFFASCSQQGPASTQTRTHHGNKGAFYSRRAHACHAVSPEIPFPSTRGPHPTSPLSLLRAPVIIITPPHTHTAAPTTPLHQS